MKKELFIGLLLAIACIMTTGCSSCQSENKKQEDVKPIPELVVENTVSTDREHVWLNYTNDYVYYETTVLLNYFLDSENQDGSIESVENIFYYVVFEDSCSGNAFAVKITHISGYKEESKEAGIWVGDEPLTDENIKLTFKQAYERVMASNYVKPHSRYCVLRKEIGSVEANPQYIFGNTSAQLYVDAVTGDVTDENPAYKGK